MQLADCGKRKRPTTHVEGIPIAFLAQLSLKEADRDVKVPTCRPMARRRGIRHSEVGIEFKCRLTLKPSRFTDSSSENVRDQEAQEDSDDDETLVFI